MMLFRAMNEDFGSEAKGMLDSGICDSGMEEVLYSKFFEIYQKSKAISN